MSRPGAGRSGSSRDDADRVGVGRDGTGRDSAGRDSGVRPGDRRGAGRDSATRDAPARDAGSRRGGERGWDEAGRDDRRNSGPQRRVAGSRDYDRDSSDDLISASAKSNRGSAGRGAARADDFDDRTARISGREAGREYPRGQDTGRSTTRESLSRDGDDRGRDERERRGNSGQNARPDSRRTTTSQSRQDDSLPDIKPRPGKPTNQSKSKRDGDTDWPSTEWDELSDVDYWAELASDKPFTGAAPSATPSSRPERDRAEARAKADSGPIRAVDRREPPDRRDNLDRRDRTAAERRDTPERRETLERRDPAERRDQLPAARATRPTVDAAFTSPVSGDSIDHAFSARTDSYAVTERRKAIATGRTSTSGPHRMPQPADDDPLTSPSFPRISADDSRSYRRSGGRGQGESQSQTRPNSAYPPAPPHPPVSPLDSQPGLARTSGGYSQPGTNGVDYAAAPLADPYRQPGSAAAESRPAQPATGSYPTSAPAAPAASYLPPAGNGYPDSATSTYRAPASATSGYPALPPGGYQAADPASYQAADPASYQAPLPGPTSAPVPFPAEHANGYVAAGPATTGYSAAPATASYQTPPADEPGYSSYPSIGQAPAAQPQSTGFSYSQPADPGFAAQLPPAQAPAAQQTDSYLGYQPSAHTGEAGVYQMPQSGMLPPQSVQPGYPSAPYSAPYEPPAYPAPTRAYEADSYPADPYAVDPYGYPGYGSARLPDQRRHGRPLSDQRWDERWRQEQSTDDWSGTTQYEYPRYWDDER